MPLDRGGIRKRAVYHLQTSRSNGRHSREEKPIVGKGKEKQLVRNTPPGPDSTAAGKSRLQNQTGAEDPLLRDFKPQPYLKRFKPSLSHF